MSLDSQKTAVIFGLYAIPSLKLSRSTSFWVFKSTTSKSILIKLVSNYIHQKSQTIWSFEYAILGNKIPK